MNKGLLLVAALAAWSSVFAADLPFFRSGRILRAEFSRIKPQGFKRLALGGAPSRPVYAAVTVKLDRGRKIGIFDYSLEVDGETRVCAAVRDDGENEFSLSADGGDKRRCTLFFELTSVPANKKAFLVCNAPGGGRIAVTFVDRGSQRFTPDTKIPDPGK